MWRMTRAQSTIWKKPITPKRRASTPKTKLSSAAGLQKRAYTLSLNKTRHHWAATTIILNHRWWCRARTHHLHAVWRVHLNGLPKRNWPVLCKMRQNTVKRPNIWTCSARSATHLIAKPSCPTEAIQSLVTANCAATSEISPVWISIPKLVLTRTTNKLSASRSGKVTKLSELKFLWTLSSKNSSKTHRLSPPSSIHKHFTYPTESHLLTGWTIWPKSSECSQKHSTTLLICLMPTCCAQTSLVTLVSLLTSKARRNKM